MSGAASAAYKPVKRKRGENAGEHFAFFKGALVVGTDWKSLLGTILIIVAPCGIFFGFVAPKVGPNISWALVAVVAAELVLALIFLGLTALRDPGFFPRDDPNRPEAKGARPAHKDHQVNGFIVQTKWCTTCNHWRPPRCSHCAVCDNCVEKFDHHCPWVGTCVGLRNYRYFLSFVFTCSLLCCSIFAFCLAELMVLRNRRYHSFGTAVRKEPANIVLMAYAFLACCFVGGLSGFHIYLTSSNQTTYEHFRHRYSPTQGNPYSRGIFRNWREVCCVPMPKRREEPLLRGGPDLEMGYVGDQEAIPAYNSAVPWQAGAHTDGGSLNNGGGNGMLNPLAEPHPASSSGPYPHQVAVAGGPAGVQGGTPSQASSSPGGSPQHNGHLLVPQRGSPHHYGREGTGHLLAPQQSRPDMQQAAEQREHESGGTITGVQGLHTKDGEEETVQPAGNRQSSYAESSDSSYTSAAGRQQSFTTTGTREVFQEPMSAGTSRPESFVTASGMSFLPQQQQHQQPAASAIQGDEYVSIPVGGDAPQGSSGTVGGAGVIGSMAGSNMSNIPPSQNQPGWQ